jgi:hypothetical protein
MSIELHCPKCMKLIRAPDNAGGRHGKCPYCEAMVYIPTPATEVEDIPLAPVDEEDERHEEELRRETARYQASLDRERDAPRGGAEGAAGRAAATAPRPQEVPGEVVDIAGNVEQFVLAMGSSKLDDADRVVGRLKRAGSRAKDYVEGLLLDPTPPPMGNLPKPLIQGFLKTLLQRLG